MTDASVSVPASTVSVIRSGPVSPSVTPIALPPAVPNTSGVSTGVYRSVGRVLTVASSTSPTAIVNDSWRDRPLASSTRTMIECDAAAS